MASIREISEALVYKYIFGHRLVLDLAGAITGHPPPFLSCSVFLLSPLER